MDRRHAWTNFILVTMLVIGLYAAAVTVGLFWMFPWYDNMMHVLGGLAIGYLALATVSHGSSRARVLSQAFGLSFLVGVAWEVFERVGNHFVPKLLAYGGPLDTFLDILYAVLGALFIALIHFASAKRANHPSS